MSSFSQLKKRTDFLKVAQEGEYKTSATLIVQRLTLSSCSPTQQFRVGFTASKRVGNAIKRNKAKRRMREMTRLWLKERTSLPCGDFVLIAKASLVTASFEKIQADFKKVLAHLQV